MSSSLSMPQSLSSNEIDIELQEYATKTDVPVLEQRAAKIESIVIACNEGHASLIADLATSDGGLLSDELRRRACMSWAC